MQWRGAQLIVEPLDEQVLSEKSRETLASVDLHERLCDLRISLALGCWDFGRQHLSNAIPVDLDVTQGAACTEERHEPMFMSLPGKNTDQVIHRRAS